jgi:hypothetical protein
MSALRQFAALHPVDPGLEALTMPAGQEFGERGDVAGEHLKVRAAAQYLFAVELLVGIEAVGVTQQPAGDVADLRRRQRGWWCAPSSRKGRR